MKYSKIDSNLFIKNRKNFVNKLEPNSVAFFNSNDIEIINSIISIIKILNLIKRKILVNKYG